MVKKVTHLFMLFLVSGFLIHSPTVLGEESMDRRSLCEALSKSKSICQSVSTHVEQRLAALKEQYDIDKYY